MRETIFIEIVSLYLFVILATNQSFGEITPDSVTILNSVKAQDFTKIFLVDLEATDQLLQYSYSLVPKFTKVSMLSLKNLKDLETDLQSTTDSNNLIVISEDSFLAKSQELITMSLGSVVLIIHDDEQLNLTNFSDLPLRLDARLFGISHGYLKVEKVYKVKIVR